MVICQLMAGHAGTQDNNPWNNPILFGITMILPNLKHVDDAIHSWQV